MSLVPIGEVRDDAVDVPVGVNLPGVHLNDDVDANTALDPANFSTTYVPASVDPHPLEQHGLDPCTKEQRDTKRVSRKSMTIKMKGGSGGERQWEIYHDQLSRHDFFSGLCVSGKEYASSFEESSTNTVTFRYDTGLLGLLNWISKGEVTSLVDHELTLLSEAEEDCKEEEFGDLLIRTMRAANFLGSRSALEQLETRVADAVDANNCLSLLCMAHELNATYLLSICTKVAVTNLDTVESSPVWESDGGMPKEVRVVLDGIRSLRSAAERYGIKCEEIPDAREYLAILREELAMQEERFEEAAEGTASDQVEALAILAEQRERMDQLAGYITSQEAALESLMAWGDRA